MIRNKDILSRNNNFGPQFFLRLTNISGPIKIVGPIQIFVQNVWVNKKCHFKRKIPPQKNWVQQMFWVQQKLWIKPKIWVHNICCLKLMFGSTTKYLGHPKVLPNFLLDIQRIMGQQDFGCRNFCWV